MFNAIKKLREAAQFMAGEESKLRTALENALKEREDHYTLPLPRPDYIELACGLLDSELCSMFPNKLKTKLTFLENNPLKEVNTGMFNPISSFDDSKVEPSALLWCLKEPLKQGIAEAINSWVWPDEVGLPRAERLAALKKLDKEIAKLQKQLEEIQSAAKAEGVAFLGIGVGDKRVLKKKNEGER